MDGIPSYSLNNYSYFVSKWHNQQNMDEHKRNIILVKIIKY